MKKLCVIGHFAFGLRMLDGQTVKTKIVTEEIKRQIGQDEVIQVDTHGGKLANLIKAPFQAFKALKKAKHVIVFPAHNGLRIFAPLLVFWKRFFKSRKLHYVVIGGWLPSFLDAHKSLVRPLKRFDAIYVETSAMKQALCEKGFTNVLVMPNCKELNVLSKDELVFHTGEPLKLCTFSRVMKEKGIEDAVDAVRAINEESGRTVYELDIYGQVDAEQTEWFEALKSSFPPYAAYRGVIPFGKSVETVKPYFALLFPTRFYTEGIPGTVIDAFASGVPVIASEWENFSDMIQKNVNGFGYPFGDAEALTETLRFCAGNIAAVNGMKENCLAAAKRYTTDTIKTLIEKTEEFS